MYIYMYIYIYIYIYVFIYTYICVSREEIEESKVLKNLLQQYPNTNNSFRESDSEYKLEEVRVDNLHLYLRSCW
jgi:hypothetical protein